MSQKESGTSQKLLFSEGVCHCVFAGACHHSIDEIGRAVGRGCTGVLLLLHECASECTEWMYVCTRHVPKNASSNTRHLPCRTARVNHCARQRCMVLVCQQHRLTGQSMRVLHCACGVDAAHCGTGHDTAPHHACSVLPTWRAICRQLSFSLCVLQVLKIDAEGFEQKVGPARKHGV